ncbi:MAG: cobalamin-dependent protein [Ferribacterium limneticum]
MDSTRNAFTLSPAALDTYDRLRDEAVDAVANAFHARLGADAGQLDAVRRQACRTDIAFHLEFLRPILETGLLQAYVDYLKWLSDVFIARNIPCDHIGVVLNLIGAYFARQMPDEGRVVADTLARAFEQSIDLGPERLAPANRGLSPQTSAFRDALLRGDRLAAVAIFEACEQAGRSLVEIYVDLVQASLVDIGWKWQHNEISVALEHLASQTAQSIMADRFSRTALAAPTGRRAILTCVDGNNHDLGLRMVAHGLEADGWQVLCLGASLPVPSLIGLIREFQPELVGLSVALPTHFTPARLAIAAMRKAFAEACPRLVVGGGAINRYPQLLEFIGADIHVADAASLTKIDF